MEHPPRALHSRKEAIVRDPARAPRSTAISHQQSAVV
jgi:hypothetical protein